MAHKSQSLTVTERFFEKVKFSEDNSYNNGISTTPCMEWQACVTRFGYGKFSLTTTKPQKWVVAHKWLWEHWVGPVPEGLQLDHLCRNPNCVNIWHLEPVTPSINTRRGVGLGSSQRKISSRMRLRSSKMRTHCTHGHPWISENLAFRKSTNRQKARYICLPCKRNNDARSKALRAARRTAGDKSL